jgi:4-amino-4-deoxy-L-arabinose transferase-like glycosyltransferase
VRDFTRSNLAFLLVFTLCALALRLSFYRYFPGVVNDSLVYGDIAKNWLQHGMYGLSGTVEVSPTYIRLPGYPAFLAVIFSIFGMENYHAVLIVQIMFDLATCFLCADLALRLGRRRAAKAAFILAALCPFLASYSAAALTETLEVFFTALALDCALRGINNRQIRAWIGCGIACGAAILLRPDGALLLIAIVMYLVWKMARAGSATTRELLKPAILVAVLSIIPLAPWTIRNWQVFHQFQPLAPRYANEPEEFVPRGFNRWVKTWIADYASVEEIYWQVPGAEVDAGKLPDRACDSSRQRGQTMTLISDYNLLLHVSPELDQRFETLAVERIRDYPLRYYLGLPLLRVFDMWLRPRTELLPSDIRWWEFNDDPKWSTVAVGFGAVNLFYIIAAAAGWLQRRGTPLLGLLVLFVVLRSAFLGTLENPEPRYTLEMFPVVITLAGAGLVKRDA